MSACPFNGRQPLSSGRFFSPVLGQKRLAKMKEKAVVTNYCIISSRIAPHVIKQLQNISVNKCKYLVCEIYKEFDLKSQKQKEKVVTLCFMNRIEGKTTCLILILPRGGYHLYQEFSLSPPNQKESDLSHLGDLSDILRGHFDEKSWGTTLRGAKVSRQRPMVVDT